jgi:hypothetical protein
LLYQVLLSLFCRALFKDEDLSFIILYLIRALFRYFISFTRVSQLNGREKRRQRQRLLASCSRCVVNKERMSGGGREMRAPFP